MADTKQTPWMKPALEYGPILMFFIGFMAVRNRTFEVAGTEYSGFILVTAVFVPLLALATFLMWRLTGHLSKMQLVTLVLVAIFGGLTVWLNDERFFKMKPTLIYLIFGGLLLVGLMRGKSWMQIVMEEAVPLTEAGWKILTWRVTGLFFALAVANEAVWRTLSTEAWVSFKTFGLPAAVFLFFMAHAKFFETHGQSKDEP